MTAEMEPELFFKARLNSTMDPISADGLEQYELFHGACDCKQPGCRKTKESNDEAFIEKLQYDMEAYEVHDYMQYHYDAYGGEKKKWLLNARQVLESNYVDKPRFSTLYDVAIEWLKVPYKDYVLDGKGMVTASPLSWDNRTELSELIQALYMSKRILVNGKPANKKEIIEHFEHLFNVDLSNQKDLYRRFTQTYKVAEDGECFTGELHELIRKDVEERNS